MLKILSAEDAACLRDFLQESKYQQAEIRDGIALRELPSKRHGNLPHLMHRTSGHNPLAVLLRLFFVGAPVDVALTDEIIPGRVRQIMLNCGLLVRDGNQYSSDVMLAPFEEILTASDPMRTVESPEHKDLVLWPNPTTWLLWRYTIPKRFDSVLDLGCGCGVQALMAAKHCGQVMATDLNVRARDFSLFNVWLNGLDNVECLDGDTYQPVDGRKFDLIVSNPPFFVTPKASDLFCSNSMELDQYCRRVIKEGAERLNEGGYLQLVCEWVQVKGQPWADRIAEWLEGTGCDAWVFKGYQEDPGQYAQKRIRETSGTVDDQTYSEWMDYYGARGVESVFGGLITLHRRSGTNWTRWDEIPGWPKVPFGHTVQRCFENRDFLDANPEGSDMSEWKPALVDTVRLEQIFSPGEGVWTQTSLKLTLTDGLPLSMNLQPLVAEFLVQCDGKRTFRELVDDFSKKANAPRDQVERECASVVRRMLERGFFTP